MIDNFNFARKCIKKKDYEVLFSILIKNLIPRKWLRFNDISVVRLENDPKINRLPGGVTMQNAEEIDIPALLVFGTTEEQVRLRWSNGDICRIARLDNDEIAGMYWQSTDQMFLNHLNYSYEIGKDTLWVYNTFVDSRYRLRGIFAHIMTDAWNSSKSMHRPFVEGHVDFDNTISLRSHERIGFKVRQRIIAFQSRKHSFEFHGRFLRGWGIRFF